MTHERNPFWDTLKAVLIVLVVLGHTGMAIGEKWLSVIYAFHMPLFIFVSGYFSKKKTLREFLSIGGGKRLIIIYLVFHIFYISLDVALGNRLSLNRILTPSFALWYILALFYWRFILQITPYKLLNKSTFIISTTFIISLASGFVPISTEMSFQRACGFLPFFFIGYYSRQQGWVNKLRRWNKWPLMLIFLLLCALNYSYLTIFYCNYFYENLNDLDIRALHLLIACAISIAVLNFTPARLKGFTVLGKYTLLVYLLHPPLIKFMNVACNYIHIQRNAFTAIIMTIIAVTFIYFIRNLRIFKFLK